MPVGVMGAIQSGSNGASTQKIAISAMFSAFAHALTAVVMGSALVATGAFHMAREVHVPFGQTKVYSSAYETASQRLELDRLRTGALRIRGGVLRNNLVVFGTERSIIESPRFEYWGAPADVAIQVSQGEAVRVLRYQHGVLDMVPLDSAMQHLMVIGQSAPRGAGLLTIAATRALGGGSAARALLAALLVLSAIGLGVWGQALWRKR